MQGRYPVQHGQALQVKYAELFVFNSTIFLRNLSTCQEKFLRGGFHNDREEEQHWTAPEDLPGAHHLHRI